MTRVLLWYQTLQTDRLQSFLFPNLDVTYLKYKEENISLKIWLLFSACTWKGFFVDNRLPGPATIALWHSLPCAVFKTFLSPLFIFFNFFFIYLL